MSAAARLDWRWPVLILAGGTLGAGARYGLGSLWPSPTGAWPWTTFWINLAGSFLLGLLLELLSATGPDSGWRRGVRLGVGTGLLGGFTTYSSFAVETAQLVRGGAVLAGFGYAMTSVVLGLALAAAGLALGRRIGHRLPAGRS